MDDRHKSLPTTGIYTVEAWTEMFGLTDHQFRKWIRKYRIPYFRPGQRFYISAEDLWACVPRVVPDGGDDGR